MWKYLLFIGRVSIKLASKHKEMLLMYLQNQEELNKIVGNEEERAQIKEQIIKLSE